MSDYVSRTAAVLRVSNATKELSPAAQRIALQGVENASDPLQLASVVEATAPAAAALDRSAQSAAIAAAAGIGSPGPMTTDRLWTIVVIGLLSLLATSLVGLIVLLALGKTVDVVVTAFTALLTGTVGLFVPSPASNKSSG